MAVAFHQSESKSALSTKSKTSIQWQTQNSSGSLYPKQSIHHSPFQCSFPPFFDNDMIFTPFLDHWHPMTCHFRLFLAVLFKIKTLPLCPLVIRISSSMYSVLSHPVGPMIPSGTVTSTGNGNDHGASLILNRHASNLTLIFRASVGLGLNLTSTVRNPLKAFLFLFL